MSATFLQCFIYIWCIVDLLFAKPNVDPNTIKTVHVIASNHLDVGFTDYMVDVVNTYWHNYYNQIWSIQNSLSTYNITFSYLTHSWLLSLYLQCPPNTGLICPSDLQKQFVLNLLSNQTLTFHAFPFNSENELYDKSLFEYGLWLSTKYLPSLISNNYESPMVMSQRDVPGITRSVIPLLIKHNISALSIGCNDQSAPPSITQDVDYISQIFMWKDIISNQSIITMIHKNGYGGISYNDAVLINGYDQALIYNWNGDNLGPYNYTQYIQQLQQIESEFPNANIIFSTLNNYIKNLLNHPNIIETLPVITAEIGDSWEYGTNSDPKKLAKFRVASNLRSKYLSEGKVNLNSYSFNNFSRFLLKNGEHTFGITFGKLNTSINAWSNAQLNKAINTRNADIIEIVASWNEQRRFGIDYALEALSLSKNKNEIDLYNDILNEYKIIDNIKEPNINNTNQWLKVDNHSQIFIIDNKLQIQFNSTSGALQKLYNINTNVDYINDSSEYGFGLFYYTTRTENDFKQWFVDEYSYDGPTSNCTYHKAYCKNGLQENADPKHQNLNSNLVNLYQNIENKNVFVCEMDMGMHQNNLKTFYGAANKMYSIFNFSNINSINIQLILMNKTYTRIPENLYFVFNGNIKYENCFVTKLGEKININDVMLNGTKHLHFIEPNFNLSFVECISNNGKGSIRIQGIDTGNVAFVANKTNNNGDLYSTFPVPLNISNDLQKGFAFVLFDNVWDTNFPYWMPFDANDMNSVFRFNLMLK
eukprot:81701_1